MPPSGQTHTVTVGVRGGLRHSELLLLDSNGDHLQFVQARYDRSRRCAYCSTSVLTLNPKHPASLHQTPQASRARTSTSQSTAVANSSQSITRTRVARSPSIISLTSSSPSSTPPQAPREIRTVHAQPSVRAAPASQRRRSSREDSPTTVLSALRSYRVPRPAGRCRTPREQC